MKRVKDDVINEDVGKSLILVLLGYDGADMAALKSP